MADHIVQIKDEDFLGRVPLWCKTCKKPIALMFSFTIPSAIQIVRNHNNKENN